jgi:predicted enzyme related to lactoylglutathione lyase
LRVSSIDDLIASLQAAEVAVETRAEWDAPETGRFARIQDPEGNVIELWEPPVG